MIPDSNLLQTKILIPRLHKKILNRDRLLAKLRDVQDSRLTCITAPTGYGKTTLSVLWAREAQQQGWAVGWLSVDGGDNDLRRYFHYLIAAIQKPLPGFGREAQDILDGQLPKVNDVVTSLVNELSAISEEVLIFLDDYHCIEDERVHQGLLRVIQGVPGQVHLVLSSRSSIPFELGLFRARRELVEVSRDDLRLSSDEISRLTQMSYQINLSPTVAQAINERTEGWLAGVHLAMMTLKDEPVTEGLLQAFHGDQPAVFDYLIEEVLSAQPPELQEFLLKTSLVDRFCAPLCSVLLEGRDVHACVEALLAQNLFITVLDRDGVWMSYHPLFSEALRKRLVQTYPDQIQKLHSLASAWFWERGAIAEGIELALAGKNWQEAAQFITEAPLVALVSENQWPSISRWIERLPLEVVEARPFLYLRYAFALAFQTEFKHSLRFLEMAQKAMKDLKQTEESGEYFAISAFALTLDDRSDLIERFASRALEILPVEMKEKRCMATILFATGKFGQGKLAEAEAILWEVLPESKQLSSSTLTPYVQKYLALIRLRQGRLGEAAGIFAEMAADPSRQYAGAKNTAAEALFYLGRIYYEWDDLKEAETQLLAGLAFCAEKNLPGTASLGECYLAWVRWAQGAGDEAESRMERAVQLAKEGSSVTFMRRMQAYQAWLYLLRKEPQRAIEWLSNLGGVFNQGNVTDRGLEARVAVRVCLVQGSLRQARETLEPLLQDAERNRCDGDLVELLALNALIDQAQGHSDRAKVHLRRSFKLSKSGTYRRTYLDLGEPMMLLLQSHPDLLRLREDLKNRLPASWVMEPDLPGLYTINSPTEALLVLGSLSNREIEVLQWMGKGYSNPEIARLLNLSVGTVKVHVHNICEKLCVKNRHQASVKGRLMGLME